MTLLTLPLSPWAALADVRRLYHTSGFWRGASSSATRP